MRRTTRIVCALTVAMALSSPLQAGGAGKAGQAGVPGTPSSAPAAPAAADVFLIDDDLSSQGCADYQGVYTRTLTALGLSYVLWETGADGSPPAGSYEIPFDHVESNQIVIYFSGDSRCGRALSYNAAAMQAYLNGGGRMLVMGQDVMYYDDLYTTAPLSHTGSINPQAYFGASFVADSAAITSVIAAPPPLYMAGLGQDLGSGATSVDKIASVANARIDTGVILRGISGGQPALGTRVSAEPTLERVNEPGTWDALPYRTELATFGLQEVKDVDEQPILLDRLAGYLRATITVEFSNTPLATYRGSTITLSARATTSITQTRTGFSNAIQQYRWDFGDGSPITATAGASVDHVYAQMGDFTVRVEVADAFGHAAVQSAPIRVGDSQAAGIATGSQVSVTVPPDAFVPSGVVTLTMTLVSGRPTSPTLGFLGQPFNIELRDANGQAVTLTHPVTLVLTYSDAAAADLVERTLRLYRWNEPDGPWELVPGTLDMAANKLTVFLDHFSRYSIQGLPWRRVFMPVLRH
jgi:hypothetical protein